MAAQEDKVRGIIETQVPGGTELQKYGPDGKLQSEVLFVRDEAMMPGWREWVDKAAVDVGMAVINTERFLLEHRYQMMAGVMVLVGVSAAVKGVFGLVEAQAFNWIEFSSPHGILTALQNKEWLQALAIFGNWEIDSVRKLGEALKYTGHATAIDLIKGTQNPGGDCVDLDVFQHDPWDNFGEVTAQAMAGDSPGTKYIIDGSSVLPTHNQLQWCNQPGIDRVIMQAQQVGAVEPQVRVIPIIQGGGEIALSP